MLRSLAILRDQGFVRYGRGTPVCPADTKSSESDSKTGPRRASESDKATEENHEYSPASASYRVYRAIKNQIVRGEWADEDFVPKTAYLVRAFSCSKTTAHRALQLLVEDGLISRFGRGYRVGAGGTQSPAFRANGSVFIVQYDSLTWPRIHRGRWGDQFVQSVFASLSGSGLEVYVADLQEDGTRHRDMARPSGYGEIERAVGKHSTPLLGFICLFSVFDFPPPAYEYLESTLGWLSRFGKPIVWFDATEEIGGFYRRSKAVTRSFGTFLKSGRLRAPLFRCRPDHAEASAVVLRILDEFGHTRVGLALFRPRVEWMRYRLQTIIQIKSRTMHHIRLVVPRAKKNPVPLTMDMSIEEFQSGIPGLNHQGVGRMLHRLSNEYAEMPVREIPDDDRDLIVMTRVLVPFFESEQCTALLLPNDGAARRVLHWCAAVGIRIPQELSVVSFDDRFEEQYPYVISSVNFGFEQLGRIAVGILRGQPPLRLREYRGVPSLPRLNHHMTIGPAR